MKFKRIIKNNKAVSQVSVSLLSTIVVMTAVTSLSISAIQNSPSPDIGKQEFIDQDHIATSILDTLTSSEGYASSGDGEQWYNATDNDTIIHPGLLEDPDKIGNNGGDSQGDKMLFSNKKYDDLMVEKIEYTVIRTSKPDPDEPGPNSEIRITVDVKDIFGNESENEGFYYNVSVGPFYNDSEGIAFLHGVGDNGGYNRIIVEQAFYDGRVKETGVTIDTIPEFFLPNHNGSCYVEFLITKVEGVEDVNLSNNVLRKVFELNDSTNVPPEIWTFDGPDVLNVNTEGNYTVIAFDADLDDIYIEIDWDDGTSELFGPYSLSGYEHGGPSGTIIDYILVSVSHSWSQTGDYVLSATAYDDPNGDGHGENTPGEGSNSNDGSASNTETHDLEVIGSCEPVTLFLEPQFVPPGSNVTATSGWVFLGSLDCPYLPDSDTISSSWSWSGPAGSKTETVSGPSSSYSFLVGSDTEEGTLINISFSTTISWKWQGEDELHTKPASGKIIYIVGGAPGGAENNDIPGDILQQIENAMWQVINSGGSFDTGAEDIGGGLIFDFESNNIWIGS